MAQQNAVRWWNSQEQLKFPGQDADMWWYCSEVENGEKNELKMIEMGSFWPQSTF